MTWSNCFSGLPVSSSNQPIYAVDWAAAPTGAWQHLAFATNVYSFTVPNALRDEQPQLFLRVGWENAASAPPLGIFEVTAFYPSGDVAMTGRITMTSLTGPSGMQGTWELAPPQRQSFTNGGVWGVISPTYVSLNLSAGAKGPYALDGKYQGIGFTGRWFNCGILCLPNGTYIARRMCP